MSATETPVDETIVDEIASDETVAETTTEEVQGAAADSVEEQDAADESDEIQAAPDTASTRFDGANARIYLCERGHRTVSLWSAPSVCNHRNNRRSVCGLGVLPLADADVESVTKMLNPLKASKKAAKKR